MPPVFRQRILEVGGDWAESPLAQVVAETGDDIGNPCRGAGYRTRE